MGKQLEELRAFFDDWKAKSPEAIEASLRGIPKEIRDKFDDFTVFTSLQLMLLEKQGKIKLG